MFPMTIQKTNQALGKLTSNDLSCHQWPQLTLNDLIFSVIAIGTADAVAGQVSSSVAKIADYLDGIGY